MTVRISRTQYAAGSQIFRADGNGLTPAMRGLAQSLARIAASTVADLVDNSGGQTADGTIEAIGSFVPAALGSSDAAQKAELEAGFANATDALKELIAQVNLLNARVPALTGALVDNIVGTAADGTIAALDVSYTGVGTAMASATGANLVLARLESQQESIALRLYKDGVLHEATGCYGTFKVNAQAGGRATVEFEFTGIYSTPTDAAFPASPSFESTLPQQVELGRLHVDGFGVAGPLNNPCVVDTFSFDIANKIDPRTSINAVNGYTGLRITDRGSSGGIDPEATLVASQDFWTKLANARLMPFGMRVGTTPGNSWYIHAPCVQYTGLTYKDRNGLQALDAALQFNRLNGDDEIMFYAC